MYAEPSQSVAVFVLGLLGLVLCQLLGPVAWIMGSNELAAIDAGRRPPENRGLARAGQILGILGSAVLILAVFFLLFIVVVGRAST